MRENAELSDEQIIRVVLAGDKELFRELVARHKNLVFASILRQVGARDVAEDLAQQTFVRAYSGLQRFRFESQFSTWLTRIALNTTASHFASRAFKESKLRTSYDETAHDVSVSEDADTQREERLRLVRFQQALAALPTRLREPLVLCGLQEMSYQEAATVLNIPVGTIRSRLNHARLRMRELLVAAEENA